MSLRNQFTFLRLHGQFTFTYLFYVYEFNLRLRNQFT